MANQWFKFYGGDYLSDPKIERLSPLERSCWITILCMASMGNDGVIEFLTVESLLNRSGIQFDPYHPEEWEKALSVLVKFKNLKMIDTNDEGQITVKNWAKRQEHNLTVAERVAKHRENKKSNADVTTDVTNVTTEENRIEEKRIDTTILTIEEENPKKPRTTLDGFEQFWSLYPKRANKVGASASWRKLTPDERTEAMQDIPRRAQSEQWKKDSGAYVPMPSRYLDEKRWEDEIATTPIIMKFGKK